MSKNLLLVVVLIIIVLTAYFTLVINSGLPKAPARSEVETAINQAKHLYGQEKESGRDFTSGPCLSNALLPGWVLDIAHSPRQAIDDLAENQCSAYREGRTSHFVELDPDGNLIRAQ